MVPSAKCKYLCNNPTNRYFSNLSSTYEPNGSYISVRFAEVSYSGEISRDNVRLGDLELRQQFGEWTQAACMSIGCFEYGYDGVLGLAPPWTRGVVPSTLSNVMPLLDRPIFALKLPHSTSDQGEISFGYANEDFYDQPLVFLEAVSVPHDLWAVSVDHVTLDSPTPLSQTFSGTVANLESSSPYIALPDELARNFSAAIGAQDGPLWFQNIPCSNRAYLPGLIFGFGGHNFTIDAFDYTLEVDYPYVGIVCLVSFFARGEFGIPEDTLLFGAPFLRGLYSVYDMSARTIGCKFVPPLHDDLG